MKIILFIFGFILGLNFKRICHFIFLLYLKLKQREKSYFNMSEIDKESGFWTEDDFK